MSNRKRRKPGRAEKITPLGRTGYRPNISIIDEVAKTFSGRYNGYICDACDMGFLTLDIDHGTTPMVSPCFATEGCLGKAVSMGYPDGEPPTELGEPIIHWVKPKPEELDTFSSAVLAHVVKGGLVRKATDATPEWVRTLM